MTKTDVIRFYDQPRCIRLQVLAMTHRHAPNQQNQKSCNYFHKRDGQKKYFTLPPDFEECIGFMVDFTYRVIIILA
ncbi:MAG: hypothetical protein WCK57_05400 [Verrucomicrobiae bacterium]|jgi:hypothetical protein